MKYISLTTILISIIIFASSKTSNAQFIKAVVPIGLNFAQVDGDEIAGYNKLGLNIGVGAMLNLNENETWEAGFEILYNRLGSKSNGAQIQLSNLDLKLQYDYVSIPFVVNYKDIGDGYLGAGIMISRLVNNKRFENSVEITPTGTTKSMDYGIFAQAGFLFSPNFRVTLRAGYSAIPFLDPRAFHNYVSLRFDTILNGLVKL